MRLKMSYSSKEEIPEGYADLFTERDGKWEFTAIDGMKTQADVDKVQTALTAERREHQKAKDALSAFGDRKPEDVAAVFEENEVLKAKVDGDGDEKVEKLVAKRVEQELGPINREKARLEGQLKEQGEELTEANGRIASMEEKENKRTIADEIRNAAKEVGITEETCVEDATFYSERLLELTEDGRVVTRDGVGVTPGITAESLLTDIKDSGKKPHWWPTAKGGGALGGSAGKGQTNPWKKETFNLTQQGEILKTNPALAKKLAAEAGKKLDI